MIGLGLGLGLSRSMGGVRYDYYVDSVNGSDANDGLTPETAFETLAATETAALAFGDGVRIGLARGSVWYEDIDLSTLDNGRLGAYGSGALPIIDGSLAVANASFSKTATYTNIYDIGVTQTLSEGYISVWEDGVMLQFVSSLAALDATPGAFYIPDDGTGSGKSGSGAHTIYVHASDSSDVTANGKSYRATDYTRNGQAYFGSGWTVSKLHTRRNMQADGSFKAQTNTTVSRCLFEDGVKHNSLIGSGTYSYCVAFSGENGVRTNSILMEFYVSNGTGLNCLYENCIAVGRINTSATPSTQVVDGFSGHNQGPGTYYDSFTATDCVAHNCTTGFSLAANLVGTTRCFASECFNGVSLSDYSGSGAEVIDQRIHNTVRAIHRSIYGNVAPILTVDGLRVHLDTTVSNSGTTRSTVFGASGSDVTISNSVFNFDDFASAYYTILAGITGGMNITMTGNLVRNGSGQDRLSLFEWYTAGLGVLTDLDNNAYYTDTACNCRVDNVAYASISAYFAAVQPAFEANSVIADAAFSDPANGDFTPGGTGLPSGAGLQRSVTYHDVPASVAEALAFVDA